MAKTLSFVPLLLPVVVLLRGCFAQEAPSDLTLQFMEDTRGGFLQHAVLDFSWTPPGGEDLTGYDLIVEHLPPEDLTASNHSCNLTQDTVTISLPRDISNYTLRSENGSFDSLPIYTCEYMAMLVSKPSGTSSDIMMFIIEYESDMQMPSAQDLRNDLDIDCKASYDQETVQYTVTATWNMSNQHPLAIEAILETFFRVETLRFSLFPFIIFNRENFNKMPEGEIITVLTCPPTLSGVAQVSAQVILPTTNDQPFYWRSDILPRTMGTVDPTCQDTIFVRAPTTISQESISFTNIDINTDIDEVSFTVEWDPPQYPNGNLTSYELCVRSSEVELMGTVMCDAVSFNVPAQNLSNPDMPSWDIPPQPITGPELSVQIRAMNDISGNWSEAANISTIPTTTSTTTLTPTPTTTPSTTPSTPSEEFPPWAIAIIVIVVVIILVVLLVVAVFLYRRHYFRKKSTEKVKYSTKKS